jgi:prophage regulatory protein
MKIPAKTAHRAHRTQDFRPSQSDDLQAFVQKIRQIIADRKLEDRILRLPQVRIKTGRANATIWKDVSAGTMPPPIRIGVRAVGWRESELDAWIEALALMSRSGQHFDMKTVVSLLIAPPLKSTNSLANPASC